MRTWADEVEDQRRERDREQRRLLECQHGARLGHCDICKRDARIAKLEAALRGVMVGGNHAALLIGADHPPYTAPHDAARKHYAGNQDAYEAWCCWKRIMMARDVLGDN